ncbi:hypothetical protein RRG08_002882 [Elysia crispata]|uniref:Uncharacterized protein n=1 Tax=Elysia crispata TaxID=231223 RepID=A0AAE1AT10_9GAST|nr:hypothetical protein RRG08_002882 [Elysia crispata]
MCCAVRKHPGTSLQDDEIRTAVKSFSIDALLFKEQLLRRHHRKGRAVACTATTNKTTVCSYLPHQHTSFCLVPIIIFAPASICREGDKGHQETPMVNPLAPSPLQYPGDLETLASSLCILSILIFLYSSSSFRTTWHTQIFSAWTPDEYKQLQQQQQQQQNK